MALTPEFISAVEGNNLLRVRIMLKDSLLVDKSFNQFTEMRGYAESRGTNFWMEKTAELERRPEIFWDTELMNLELTRLVNDFTKERLAYCQAIIQKIYGINSTPKQAYPSDNGDNYKAILSGVTKMNRILRKNETSAGRIWREDDIKAIQAEAERISRACEGIIRRG